MRPGVRDAEQAVPAADRPEIANLTTTFGVEGRLVQDDQPLLPLP